MKPDPFFTPHFNSELENENNGFREGKQMTSVRYRFTPLFLALMGVFISSTVSFHAWGQAGAASTTLSADELESLFASQILSSVLNEQRPTNNFPFDGIKQDIGATSKWLFARNKLPPTMTIDPVALHFVLSGSFNDTKNERLHELKVTQDSDSRRGCIGAWHRYPCISVVPTMTVCCVCVVFDDKSK